jgi:lipoprotein signal peptidase
MHPERSRARRTVGIASTGVLVADQATKGLSAVVTTRYRNPDFALGLGTAPRLVMIALIAALIVVVAQRLVVAAERGRVPALAAGLVIGGAVGNLIDRVLFGAVHDFVAIGPIVANLADVAVLVGVLWCATSVHFHPHGAGGQR